jgi:glycosyltransferase involved in cell wall biosynthesis
VCANGRTQLTLMHGKRSLERGTLIILEAIARAAKTIPNLRVLMFNKIPPERDAEYPIFAEAIQKHNLGGVVELRDGVPHRSMATILRECDVGMVAYGRELGTDSLPNRLFEYMAVGLPVIVPSYAREMAAIARAEACGLIVDFEKVAEIEEAIVSMWKDPEGCRAMGQRARAAFIERHNWETECRPVLETINGWQRETDK